MKSMLYPLLSHEVLGACFAVHNCLGCGLLENVYEEALCIELESRGISLERQKYFPVYYKGLLAGSYVADMVVSGKIIIELKSVNSLKAVFESQLINYLKIARVPVGYLVNFKNERVEFKRFVVPV